MNKAQQNQMLQGRTVQDAKQWDSTIGKIYYHRCKDDSRYFRTIRVVHNPFTNANQPQVSNPVYGDPPPTVPEIPPMMLTKLMRVQQMGTFY